MATVAFTREIGSLSQAGSAPSRDLQELWFATRRREWKSLCILPAAPGESTLAIAEALANVGRIIRRTPPRVVRAEKLELSDIAQLVMEMTEEVPAPSPASTVWTSSSPRALAPSLPISQDAPVIIAIESVVSNPLMLPVALAADCVLLCIHLGKTDLPSARHTIAMIGRDRLIGAVLVRSR